MTTKIAEHERSMSPPPPPVRGRSPRRAHGQTGYDSDTAVQQYYTSPTRRLRDPSPPDEWIRNPGGIPAKVIIWIKIYTAKFLHIRPAVVKVKSCNALLYPTWDITNMNAHIRINKK